MPMKPNNSLRPRNEPYSYEQPSSFHSKTFKFYLDGDEIAEITGTDEEMVKGIVGLMNGAYRMGWYERNLVADSQETEDTEEKDDLKDIIENIIEDVKKKTEPEPELKEVEPQPADLLKNILD